MDLAAADLLRFFDEDLGLDTEDLSEDSPLFSSGVIDSFTLLSVMGFLEDRGGFRFDPSEVTLENLDTVERLLAFYAGARGRS